MENITQEFLKKCKEAGYEKVTIFIRDKRVPLTKRIKDGAYFGSYRPDDPEIEEYPHTVVCGCPEQLGTNPSLLGSVWPKMWRIVKECGLTAGMQFGGFGLGDAHNIQSYLREMLTAGYYDLNEMPKELR